MLPSLAFFRVPAPCVTLVAALFLSCGLALGCGGKEPPAEAAPERSSRPDPTKPRPGDFPEVPEAAYRMPELGQSALVRIDRLEFDRRTRSATEKRTEDFGAQDPVAVRVKQTIEERASGENGERTARVEKEIVYGLRGLLKFSDRHRRIDASGDVTDDWHNRIVYLESVEGDLFPLDYARLMRLRFTSEMENKKTGKTILVQNDYNLQVAEVLTPEEFVARMPFESFESNITQRVFAVRLDWTLTPEGGRQVNRSTTYLWSPDLGFALPCCNSKTTRYENLELARR